MVGCLPLAALKTAPASLPLEVPTSMTHIETVVGRQVVITSPVSSFSSIDWSTPVRNGLSESRW